MQIGELSIKSGFSRDTIRYYEKVGLFQSTLREENNYRIYDDRSIVILKLIKRCKTLGFTLKEINEYLDGIVNGNLTFGDLQKAISKKIAYIESNIFELKENMGNLERILEKCSKSQIVKNCID